MTRRETAEASAARAVRMLEAGDREGAVEALLGYLRDDVVGEVEVARLIWGGNGNGNGEGNG